MRTDRKKPIPGDGGKTLEHVPSVPAAQLAYSGPRPIGALVPGITKLAFRSHGWMVARLIGEWEQIVGPALAAETVPLKVAGGTLTIGCAGPVGLELQHLAPMLLARISAQLGATVAERLRVVQHVVAARAEAEVVVTDSVEQEVAADLPTDTLDEALAALAAAVRRDRASHRRKSRSPRANATP